MTDPLNIVGQVIMLFMVLGIAAILIGLLATILDWFRARIDPTKNKENADQ